MTGGRSAAAKRRLRREVRIGGLCPAGSGATRLRLHAGLVEPARSRSSPARSPRRRADRARLAIGRAKPRDGTRASRIMRARECLGGRRAFDRAGGDGTGTDTEVPVVFPGYVLPDDSLEDSGA